MRPVVGAQPQVAIEEASPQSSQSLAEQAVALKGLDYRPENDVDQVFGDDVGSAWEAPAVAEDAVAEETPQAVHPDTGPAPATAAQDTPVVDAAPELNPTVQSGPATEVSVTLETADQAVVVNAEGSSATPTPSGVDGDHFAMLQAIESLHSANGPPAVSALRLSAQGPNPSFKDQDITGDFTLTAADEFEVRIGGAPSSNQFDKLKVSNKAELAGTLKITLVNSPTLTVGDRFDFLTFGSTSGDFAVYKGLQLGNGLYFEPELHLDPDNPANNRYSLVVAKLPENVDIDANPAEIADAFLALVAGKNAGPVSLGAAFKLNVLGVEISGKVEGAVEKPANEAPITTLRAEEVSLSFVGSGGEIVKLTGSGSILVTKTGVAGTLNVSATLSAGNADLSAGARGSLTLILNTTSAAVDKAVKVGDRVVAFNLEQGPYIRVIARDVELTFTTEGTQFTLVGNLDIERLASGEVNVEVTGAGLNLVAGTASLEFKEGAGAFTFTKDGVAGVARGTASLRGVDGLLLSGSFDLEFNNTGTQFKKTIGRRFWISKEQGKGTCSRWRVMAIWQWPGSWILRPRS